MIVAIIQARMGSSRLPGKVFMELSGHNVLWHVINRIRSSKLIDKIMIATTVNEKDAQIVEFCNKNEVLCFAGSENDVLDRFNNACESINMTEDDVVVRITADCPMIDPVVIDNTIELFIKLNVDYASNVNPPTFPDGLDVEVVKKSAITRAFIDAKLISEREHVTPYIRNNPDIFLQANYVNDEDLSALRWTLDEIEDFDVISQIYKTLYREGEIFLLKDILALYKDSDNNLSKNLKYHRNEGYDKSIKNDSLVIPV